MFFFNLKSQKNFPSSEEIHKRTETARDIASYPLEVMDSLTIATEPFTTTTFQYTFSKYDDCNQIDCNNYCLKYKFYRIIFVKFLMDHEWFLLKVTESLHLCSREKLSIFQFRLNIFMIR